MGLTHPDIVSIYRDSSGVYRSEQGDHLYINLYLLIIAIMFSSLLIRISINTTLLSCSYSSLKRLLMIKDKDIIEVCSIILNQIASEELFAMLTYLPQNVYASNSIFIIITDFIC